MKPFIKQIITYTLEELSRLALLGIGDVPLILNVYLKASNLDENERGVFVPRKLTVEVSPRYVIRKVQEGDAEILYENVYSEFPEFTSLERLLEKEECIGIDLNDRSGAIIFEASFN